MARRFIELFANLAVLLLISFSVCLSVILSEKVPGVVPGNNGIFDREVYPL